MDTLEFIDKLKEDINKQKEIKDKLVNEHDKAYKRTKEYFRELIKEKEKVSDAVFVMNSTTSIFGGYEVNGNRVSEQSSYEQIIDLSYELKSLKVKCEELEKEISEYKSDDISAYLKEISNGN